MASLIKYFHPQAKPYHAQKKRYGREEAQARVAATSRTIYIGNLAFVTTEAQIHALFSRCGSIEKVVMGLNRVTRSPCGFGFVIFMRREAVIEAMNSLNGTVLDERIIKVEVDKGFYEGRQYGRGESGGQVRDDMRSIFDEGRGGYGLGAAAGASDGSTPQQSTPLLGSPYGGQQETRRSSGEFRGGRGGFRGRRDSGGSFGGSPGYGNFPRAPFNPAFAGGTPGGMPAFDHFGGTPQSGYRGGRGRGNFSDRGRNSFGGYGSGGRDDFNSGFKRQRPSFEDGRGFREDQRGEYRSGGQFDREANTHDTAPRPEEDRVRDRYREGREDDRERSRFMDDLDEFGRVRRQAADSERKPAEPADGDYGVGVGAAREGSGRFDDDSDEERGQRNKRSRRDDY